MKNILKISIIERLIVKNIPKSMKIIQTIPLILTEIRNMTIIQIVLLICVCKKRSMMIIQTIHLIVRKKRKMENQKKA